MNEKKDSIDKPRKSVFEIEKKTKKKKAIGKFLLKNKKEAVILAEILNRSFFKR